MPNTVPKTRERLSPADKLRIIVGEVDSLAEFADVLQASREALAVKELELERKYPGRAHEFTAESEAQP